MELVEVEVGYDYQVKGRPVGLRDARWLILGGVAPAAIPSVAADEAPEAAALAFRNGYRERYRAFGDRLYRRVTVPADPSRPAAEPLLLADAVRAGPLRIGNVGRLPWRWIEKDAERLYDGARRNAKGELVADVEENRADRSLVRLGTRIRDELLVVDGMLHVACDPPMIQVHAQSGPIAMLSGVEMERSDPEFDRHGNNQTTLFAVDRVADAEAFAARLMEFAVEDFARVHRMGTDEARARLGADAVRVGPRLGAVEIVPGFEHLVLVDEMVAGARRNIPFLGWALAENVFDMDARGIAAFSAMREAVTALETPEGRTRANARAAFEAVAVMAGAQPGGWSGEDSARASLDTVRRYTRHLVERYRTDPRFAPQAEEIMAPEDETAMRALEIAP